MERSLPRGILPSPAPDDVAFDDIVVDDGAGSMPARHRFR
jgi:hypothetical protein